jgi:ATP-dependent RNA helicase RhlE
LHGDRTQGQRISAINGFKDGRYQILVATDIAARGLDVENISHVINFDMPDTSDAYIHRIGRTGRAERHGQAFTFITPKDKAMVHSLEKIIGRRLDRQRLDGFDYDLPPSNPQGSSTKRARNLSTSDRGIKSKNGHKSNTHRRRRTNK